MSKDIAGFQGLRGETERTFLSRQKSNEAVEKDSSLAVKNEKQGWNSNDHVEIPLKKRGRSYDTAIEEIDSGNTANGSLIKKEAVDSNKQMRRSSIPVDSTEIGSKTIGKRRSKVKQVEYFDDEYIDNFAMSDPEDEDNAIKEELTAKKKGTRKKIVENKEIKAAELIIDKILAIRMKPKVLPLVTPVSVAAALTNDVCIPSKADDGDTSTNQKNVTSSNSSSSGSSSSSSRNDNITATSNIDTDLTVISQKSEIIGIKNEPASSRQLLVKHLGKSYRALKWIDEDEIKSSEYSENKLKGFLRVFKKKEGIPYAAETSEGQGPSFSLESVVDMDWMEVERIIDIFEEEEGVHSLNKRPSSNLLTDSTSIANISSSNKGNGSGEKNKKNTSEIAYVKWRGLGYAECTWEAWEEVQSELVLINQYRGKELDVKRIIKGNELKSKGSADKNGRRVLIAGANGRFTLSREDIPVRNVELRDYQVQGINWLLFQWTQERSCLLADEMGLGKTMQALGFIETLREMYHQKGPVIIVVPLSTIRHWQKEFDERSNSNTVVMHGTNEDRESFIGSEFTNTGGRSWVPHFDVMITTYESVQQELAFLKEIKWTAMVIDEAHRLKNSATQVRAALKDLKVDFSVLLTGAPIYCPGAVLSVV